MIDLLSILGLLILDEQVQGLLRRLLLFQEDSSWMDGWRWCKSCVEKRAVFEWKDMPLIKCFPERGIERVLKDIYVRQFVCDVGD